MKEKERELENNIFFWQKLDTLIFSGKLQVVREKGQASADYPRLRYPVDFCKITDAISAAGMPLYCFRGSLPKAAASAVIVQADILSREVLTKVLVGCTDEECEMILKFINAAEFQKAILIHRGLEFPAWENVE